MDQLTKQFLVKVADGFTPMPAFQGNIRDMAIGNVGRGGWSGVGAQFGTDIQSGLYATPGSPEFNQEMQARKWSPEYANAVNSMRQRVMSMSQDPQALRDMMSGNFNFSSLGGDINADQLLGISPAPAQQQAANQGWVQGLVNRGTQALTGRTPEQLGQLAPFIPALGAQESARALMNPDQYKAMARSQAIGGLTGSLNWDSPLVARARTNLGTQFLHNKVDDWTRNWTGGFGSGIRGFGHALIGLLSKIPGYQYLLNKGIDWFGPQNLRSYFPATPGQTLPAPAAAPAAAPKATPVPQPAPAAPGAVKKSSAPYSHYHVVYRSRGIEVLSPWNHR